MIPLPLNTQDNPMNIETFEQYQDYRKTIRGGLGTEELSLAVERFEKENSIEVCPVCDVAIRNKEIVHFSYGKPGSCERLYARVCQFSKEDGCINITKSVSPEVIAAEGYVDIGKPFLSNQAISDLAQEFTNE